MSTQDPAENCNPAPESETRHAHSKDAAGFSTRAIHWGYNPHEHQGALVPPLYICLLYTSRCV